MSCPAAQSEAPRVIYGVKPIHPTHPEPNWDGLRGRAFDALAFFTRAASAYDLVDTDGRILLLCITTKALDDGIDALEARGLVEAVTLPCLCGRLGMPARLDMVGCACPGMAYRRTFIDESRPTVIRADFRRKKRVT